MEIHFDEELSSLKRKLLDMADTAQEMTGLAVRCLTERDEAARRPGLKAPHCGA